MAHTVVIDVLQLAGFLFGGWLLFRGTEWVYRWRSEDDHEVHGPRDPAQFTLEGHDRQSAAHR